MQFTGSQHGRIREYLKKHAPFSIVELGIALASEGNVIECSKSGSRVFGSVRDHSDQTFSVSLDVVSAKEIDAACGCSSSEEMSEQWCCHSVALLWRSCELDFFSSESGFPAYESTYRMSTTSPVEIAKAISQVSITGTHVRERTHVRPRVSVQLDLRSDRLGAKVHFDGEVQSPRLFGDISQHSDRALDNILIQTLDGEGNWDDESNIWYINSSKGIELVLGLLQEYEHVTSLNDGVPVQFAHDLLEARLRIVWCKDTAELSMYWIDPRGAIQHRDSDLIGTGPYWTLVGTTLYRISPSAARIASIFPYTPLITLSRGQVGPILEVIRDNLFDPALVEIINPELQPESIVADPVPVIELQKREIQAEHFTSSQALELYGNLEFQYPSPPEGENLVYLPNRELERAFTDQLKAIGFVSDPNSKILRVTDEAALDLVYKGSEALPSPWKLPGLNAIRKGLRFSDLSLSVAITPVNGKGSSKKNYGIDWFDCHISLTQNNSNVPLSTLFKTARPESDRWIRLDSGAYARVPGGGLQQLKMTLGMLDSNFRLSNTMKTKLSSAQAVGLSRMSELGVQVSSDSSLQQLQKRIESFEAIRSITPSKNFKGKLRPYQADGLSWLNFLCDFSLDGILADEMGLGKTVQTLAFLQYLKDRKSGGMRLTKPAMVVAPTSVIMNWWYEAKRFAPDLNTVVLHGPERKALLSQIKDYDVVITSYALMRLDRTELEKHQYSYVILDEAQHIKNPQTATTRAAKALNCQRRLALTGTPTENRPMELWSIIDFLMPGYLGSYDFFKNSIEKPILESGPAVEAGRVLHSRVRPFIMRRLKAQVERDLPPKVESVMHVEMTPSQQELYAQILADVRPRVFELVEKRGIRGASISILAALLRLRQVCNHPNSIDALKDAPGYESGKFNLMCELVEEALSAGRKILLFSQFREMLNIIRMWLDEQGISYLYLDGATRNRHDLVEKFNSDPSVRLFLISLKAGGTGLNLTAADTVFIYDPWWNPAVESQAVDRAHRIGQTKKVTVYRLVTENSIEQKIMELKKKKGQIVDALINEDTVSTLTLTKKDLESLFSPIG